MVPIHIRPDRSWATAVVIECGSPSAMPTWVNQGARTASTGRRHSHAPACPQTPQRDIPDLRAAHAAGRQAPGPSSRLHPAQDAQVLAHGASRGPVTADSFRYFHCAPPPGEPLRFDTASGYMIAANRDDPEQAGTTGDGVSSADVTFPHDARTGPVRRARRPEAARRAHASAQPRRHRGPAASGRPGQGTAARTGGGQDPLDGAVGATRLWQDHPGAAGRALRGRGFPCHFGGALRFAGCAQGAGRGRGAVCPRPAHGVVRRRSAPFQQDPAGRVPATYRKRRDHLHRCHHREPVVRAEFGAAVALPRTCAGAGVGRRHRGCAAHGAGRRRARPR